MDCIFCSLVNQHPQNKISENNSFLALLDMNPVSKGHTIIVPTRHVESYFDLNGTENVDLKAIILSLKSILKEKVKPDGYNIGVNEGEAAGATTKHLIVHMIPRFKGDVQNPVGGIRNILGASTEHKEEVKKEDPKKEEPKPQPKVEVKKEPPKQKSWQELLEDNKKRKREDDIIRAHNKFK